MTHTNIELALFKEEILKTIRQTENKILSQVQTEKKVIISQLNNCSSSITDLKKETEDIKNTLINHKTKIDKMSELELFRIRTDNTIISNNIKINNVLKETDAMRIRYDKLISDNLLIPGHIGPACKYKSLAEYIKSTIIDIPQMKFDTEDSKTQLADLKKKSENMLNSVISLVDKGIERCKEYTDKKQKDIDNFLKKRLKEIEDESTNLREEWIKANNLIQKNYNELKESMENLPKFKNEIIEIMEQNNINIEAKLSKKHQLLSNNLNENENKLNEFIDNFNKMQREFQNLKQDVLYIQLNKNIKRKSSLIYNNFNLYSNNKNDNQMSYDLPNKLNNKLNKNDKININNILNNQKIKNSLLYSNTTTNNLEVVDKNNENEKYNKLNDKYENIEIAINKESGDEEEESQQFLDSDKMCIKPKYSINEKNSEKKKKLYNKNYNNNNDNSCYNQFYKSYCNNFKQSLFNNNNKYISITDYNKNQPETKRKILNINNMNVINTNDYPLTSRQPKEKNGKNVCNNVDLFKLVRIDNRSSSKNNILPGKKITQKKNSDNEHLNGSFSLDNVYRNYYNKQMKNKKNIIKSELLPKKVTSAFGSTVYQFFKNDLKKENTGNYSHQNYINNNDYNKIVISPELENNKNNVVNVKFE